jgi:hypothetical protein
VFGDSPFLTTSDYEVTPALADFAAAFELAPDALKMTLKPAAVTIVNAQRSARVQFRVQLTVETFSNRNGAFRVGNGSDVLSFWGSSSAPELRPRLTLVVQSRGAAVPPPMPSPAYPVGPVGTIVAGGTTFVEATCDGGAAAGVCACVRVCMRACVRACEHHLQNL